jgi:hypothetical protein
MEFRIRVLRKEKLEYLTGKLKTSGKNESHFLDKKTLPGRAASYYIYI